MPSPKGTDTPTAASGHSRCNTWGDTTEAIINISTQVATIDNTAAHQLRRMGASPRRAMLPIALIVAVLDTNPPSRPDTARPARVPSKRCATWPTACISKIMITSISTRCGDSCPSQLKGVDGKSGNSTSTRADSSRPSCSSCSLSHSVAKWCRRSRAASTAASSTAQPAASAGCDTDSMPIKVVASSASSVVMPGSRERLRQ